MGCMVSSWEAQKGEGEEGGWREMGEGRWMKVRTWRDAFAKEFDHGVAAFEEEESGTHGCRW